MNRLASRAKNQQKTRKTVPLNLALITTALLVMTIQPVIQPTNVFAQTSSETAEARAAARAAAKARAKERAKDNAREMQRLFPKWDQRFNTEMIRFLERKFGITATNLNGRTFGDIITTRGNHSIRADRKDCVSCHGQPALLPGAGRLPGITERQFCNRVPGFRAVDKEEFEDGHKPKELKFFLGMWRMRSCGIAG